jgi:hypothetical protein
MAKTTTPQTSNNAPTQEWGVIHIFGYGETQIIGDGMNKKFPTTDLLKVQDVVDYIYSFKPEGNESANEYHIINVFKNNFVSFIPKDSTSESWKIEYADLDSTTIEALSTELLNKPTTDETTSSNETISSEETTSSNETTSSEETTETTL